MHEPGRGDRSKCCDGAAPFTKGRILRLIKGGTCACLIFVDTVWSVAVCWERKKITLMLKKWLIKLEIARKSFRMPSGVMRTTQHISPAKHGINSVVNCMLAYESTAGQKWELTNLKLQKLAYLAQGFFLAENNQELFSDKIEAWPYGPLIPKLYAQLRIYGRNVITRTLPDTTPIEPGSKEESVIRGVMDSFAFMPAMKLVGISHLQNSPWAVVWKSGYGRYQTIPSRDIASYFQRLINKTAATPAP